MFIVWVNGRYRLVESMAAAAAEAQAGVGFRAFGSAPEAASCPPLRLDILDEAMGLPFAADREAGIRISAYQSERISRYAGLDQPTYLMLCAMLGLTQWRALHENDDIRPEDFIHDHGKTCLFSHRVDGTFPVLLENPNVCGGCIGFYHALGADGELIALLDAVRYAAAQANGGNRLSGRRGRLECPR